MIAQSHLSRMNLCKGGERGGTEAVVRPINGVLID